jgi:putative SOS response-associated peptidase YedK
VTATRTAATTIDPGQLDRIIRARPDGSREAIDSYWGLLPAWTENRNGAGRPINARAETLMETATFRPLVRSHRCIIAVTAFYERMPTPTGRRRVAIRRRDGRGLALAGLWTSGIDRATGAPVTRHVLITCAPNAFMAAFHHRMPVVLDGGALDAWLDPTVRAPAAVLPLLVPCADDLLVADADEPADRRPRPQPAGDQLAFPT